MRIPTILIAATFALLIALPAPTNAKPKKKSAFETTHVTLYDCGIAQLEKQAKVNGATSLSIDVPLAHLDDMLATLMLATDESVKVKGVNYPSVQNLPQAVAESGLGNAMSPDDGGLTMPEGFPGYVQALVGTLVSVTGVNKKRTEGTVLACMDRKPDGSIVNHNASGPTVVKIKPDWTMVLVTETGSLVWISLDDVSQISPKSKREAGAIKDLADRMGKANGFNKTPIVVETTAGSKGLLGAAFIRQMPLWKTLYRVTVQNGNVFLEIWAQVHNDTEEDWKEVEMSLISGLPKSYVVSMASPRYAEREALWLETEGNMMPQLGAHTPDTLLYEWENYGYGMLASHSAKSPSIRSASGYGSGAGYGYGSVGTSTRQSSLLTVGQAAAEEQAEAAVEQEISVYKAMNKVTVPAGTSSMVPLLRKRLTGESFTLVKESEKPSTCVRIENETGLVLQNGLASFYKDGRFRGQTEIGRTEPSDVGIWCFGEDMDVAFTKTLAVRKDEEMLEWKSSSLWAHSLRTSTVTYNLENRAGQARQVAIDVRHLSNGRIVSPKNLLESDTDNRKLVLLDLPARSEISQNVVLEEGVADSISISRKNLERLSKVKTLLDSHRSVLKTVVSLMDENDDLNESIDETRKKIVVERAEIDDLRKTLEAVPDTRRRNRMVERFVEEILACRKRIKHLTSKLKTQTDSLDTIGKRTDTAWKKLENPKAVQ